MSDPGTIIAIVTIAYSVAVASWKSFKDALDYSDQSADLVVRLEVERFRFQTWGKNVGLNSGNFDKSLYPIHTLIVERINRINKLFEEAGSVRDSLDLDVSEAAKPRPDRVHSLISGMGTSIRSIGIKLDMDEKPQRSASFPRRIKWALTSKSRLSDLVTKVESHIDKLNELLTETQKRSLLDDWKKINIVIIGNIPEEQIEFVQQAFGRRIENGPPDSYAQLDSLLQRKAIKKTGFTPSWSAARSLERRQLDEFELPGDFTSRNRFLARATPAATSTLGPDIFCLEKKEYHQDISVREKAALKTRLDRLILLLSSSKSEDFRVCRAVGYCEDPSSFCWWLIFRFPCSLEEEKNFNQLRHQPLNLNLLFSLKEFKPALEQRFELASNLAKTMAELYNSGWMHKGVRSENVLFPTFYEKNVHYSTGQLESALSPYIAGFEYSRQDTEAATIDKGRRLTCIDAAIYRHPYYQGEAASGYKVQYDIYSFGLVLVEIAFWVPLKSFLNSKPIREKPRVQLSPDMTHFHEEEALELRDRVIYRIDNEMHFRVGSKFRDAVKWCLTFSENSDEDDWHPALGFHNNVIVPLDMCATLGQI
ncbi:prion-inhibition and propagation-domain-containing protein [Xylogone sp. PMI_703]|nr:prion-inhibition and propagation-domain-containing protein [Xylogone sp. PMI_703]